MPKIVYFTGHKIAVFEKKFISSGYIRVSFKNHSKDVAHVIKIIHHEIEAEIMQIK